MKVNNSMFISFVYATKCTPGDNGMHPLVDCS